MKCLGRYECKKTIGKGGMGEVLLAYDPECERQVAIKKIRPDLKDHPVIKNRFLREAKLTAQLTHPGIIAIYSIHQEDEELYYTMPYVDGETLKQILSKSPSLPISSFLPIFKSICQTIAYAHSKGILHRDLKPENFLVGKFGEVIVLDWGLAQFISEPSQEWEDLPALHPELTSPGKLIGTVAYMAPERALGAPATILTDIYSLGVILYQILTLRFPFERSSVKEFRKNYKRERMLDPEEVAPYRDVPPRLSRMVKKCLDPDPQGRYQTVDALLHELKNYMEGKSEWFESARLSVAQKRHWEFQENVLISKHIAITRIPEATEWVSIMVSKTAFAENIRLETHVRIGKSGAGIGFLLNIPEASERENPLEGYCLWLGSEEFPLSQLFRNTVEVMHIPDLFLKREERHSLIIEKIDHKIQFYLNGQLRFTYISYLPLFGTHIGVLARDADFEMEEIVVSIGSQNLQVSCLAVPDAFLASKDYKRALAEYWRIGYSFPGHAEGREALFRAGITLLEQARTARSSKRAEAYYTLALEEFAKLHHTPGAPLEYLGKALVYQALNDPKEEIKCLELGLRRYAKHPLVSAIREQLVYRMHEAAQTDRVTAYQLILIALRLIPEIKKSSDSERLFNYVISHWEPLSFHENAIDPTQLGREKPVETCFAGTLAFWLAMPHVLQELFLQAQDAPTAGDLLFSLFELGAFEPALDLMKKTPTGDEMGEIISRLNPLAVFHQQSIEEAMIAFFAINKKDMGVREIRTLSYLLQRAIFTDQEKKIEGIGDLLQELPLSREDRIELDSYRIWSYLKQKKWKKAEEIFETYPLELLNQETTLLHPLYGSWLLVTEGSEISDIHFAGVIDTPFPRSWALLGHELTNKILESTWFTTSFLWERRRLYQQLALYYRCAGNPDLESYYMHLERKEYVSVDSN